ncbi:hypothetical protein ACI797_07425 [Geodermatophilus sp. SYSU D00691]
MALGRPRAGRGRCRAWGAVALLLLAGCGSVVVGSPTPGPGVPVDATATEPAITGAVDDPVDRLARNALADLETFWSETFPEVYGAGFPAVVGGYFSVEGTDVDRAAYPPTGIGCPGQPIDPAEVTGQAFYSTPCDAVSYDRGLLREFLSTHGPALPAVLLAHEFGHVVQGRVGFAASGRSIQDETQADCFAGAWVAWVVAGSAAHVAVRVPDLDDVARGFGVLRDPVGGDPEGSGAHGSWFDRLSAFAEGYEDGAAACRDGFGADRLFTATAFDPAGAAGRVDAPYGGTVRTAEETLAAFWTSVFPGAFGRAFALPRLEGFDGTGPGCAAGRDLAYCASVSTVYADEAGLLRPAAVGIGDFAVAAALSLPYSLAVRAQLGLPTAGARATRSAVCLTGWYAAQLAGGAVPGVATGPGDVDEAVQFLLVHGVEERVLPGSGLRGFDLLRAFRDGFLRGGGPCGVGA